MYELKHELRYELCLRLACTVLAKTNETLVPVAKNRVFTFQVVVRTTSAYAVTFAVFLLGVFAFLQ